MNENNKYALVTGGTSGIGLELAKLLAADSYNLIIVARSDGDLARVSSQLKNEYGVDVITIAKDLFERRSAFDLYHDVKARNIDVDILINNAGHGHYGEFLETDLEMELKIVDLNIASLVILTKLFLKDMVARRQGKIMNLSSIASKAPGPWQSVYHGTKAFVQSFTEAVRSEVKESGVTITALLPGATDTDFFNKAGMEESKIYQEGKLYDAVDVARDGYKALLDGDDMVVSGFGNKMQVAMSAVTTDEKLADKMNKQQEPVTTGRK
ncbi:SDR family NAD(P)-dependent oxidoreductase [Pseudochryseolinea flava]|uniref:Oxidoreductase n=1 Tax=Pseudochryseolinea flava TaxID=2059302 RepID=A0A364Y6U9_9BACT|nr:SDR family oxidoreductase [Pseudochryseolinea flava]RAW02127.1 oxidoreductase [Pseudochryseolinea flava]